MTQIHLATVEDKNYDLDKWARLFKATTWEDFWMISAENKSMREAGETLYTLSKEDQIRYQCEAREEYRRTWNTVKLQLEDYQSEIQGLRSVIAKKDSFIAEKNSSLAEKDLIIARLESQIAELQHSFARQ